MVETDHKPLETIHKKSLASTPPRLQRMLLCLQHYNVSIKHSPSKEMVLADSLSRLSPIPDKEIHLEQSIYAVQFTHDKLQQLKLESESDPEVTAIRNIIIDGWPDSAKQLPKNLREFWSCKDELSVEDGLVLKGERVLIPTTMRSYILRNIHAGHQGMEKCKLRAKTCVYWKGINADIERTVKTCSICQSNQSSQQAETLLPHDIPDGPWQVLATDIFHLDGNDYVIVADYYSKMPFVRRLTSNSTSATVISVLKQLFGEHGIPHKLLSDNGPQYDYVEFRTFAADWGFKHVTSSPRYPSPTDLPNAWSRLSRKPCPRQGRAALIQTSLCCAYAPLPSKTTSPPLPNSYTPGSSDPAFLSSPPTHPKIQLSTRTCKPASGRRRSTMTGAPVTFHHSTPANMSACRKPTGPGHQPLLSRRGPNRVRTPFALQMVVSTVVIVASSGTSQHHPNISHGQTRPAPTSTVHLHRTSNNR